MLDKSQSVRAACVKAAESRGLECRFAGTVPEAISMVYEDKPSVIVTSLRLSVMRGDVLIAALAASSGHRSIPTAVIIQTDSARDHLHGCENAVHIDSRKDFDAQLSAFYE